MAPPAGPDSTSRTGNSAAVSTEMMPAARMHHQQRTGRARRLQRLHQPVEVRLHDRLDIGVGADGVEALVLAHLRRDFRRDRDRQLRQALLQRIAHRAARGRRSCSCAGSRSRRSRSRRRRSASTTAAMASSSGRHAGSCRRRRSRSSSVNRSQRGISGGGSVMFRSYCSKRLSVRISMTSRKPAVVTSAVRAPLRWISALVASVVPWMIVPMSATAMPACATTSASTVEDGAFRAA